MTESRLSSLKAAPPAANAPARRRTAAERLEFELAPILAAQRRLIGAMRVLESLHDAIGLQNRVPALRGTLEAALTDACSTFLDPICDCQSWEVVEDLARVAENLCGAILDDEVQHG